MEFKSKVGKREFIVTCDKESIKRELQSDLQDFEENSYVEYYTVDDYLTQEQYEDNVVAIMKALDEYTTIDKMQELILLADKKKNGTFYKRRIASQEACGNCHYFCEWHNSWSYKVLKVKAVSDTELRIVYETVTDTPC